MEKKKKKLLFLSAEVVVLADFYGGSQGVHYI